MKLGPDCQTVKIIKTKYNLIWMVLSRCCLYQVKSGYQICFSWYWGNV